MQQIPVLTSSRWQRFKICQRSLLSGHSGWILLFLLHQKTSAFDFCSILPPSHHLGRGIICELTTFRQRFWLQNLTELPSACFCDCGFFSPCPCCESELPLCLSFCLLVFVCLLLEEAAKCGVATAVKWVTGMLQSNGAFKYNLRKTELWVSHEAYYYLEELQADGVHDRLESCSLATPGGCHAHCLLCIYTY